MCEAVQCNLAPHASSPSLLFTVIDALSAADHLVSDPLLSPARDCGHVEVRGALGMGAEVAALQNTPIVWQPGLRSLKRSLHRLVSY